MINLTPLPKNCEDPIYWSGCHGNSPSLLINHIAEKQQQHLLIITANLQQAHELQQNLLFFQNTSYDIALFPDWETLPFDRFSPHPDIISQRLLQLYELAQKQQGITIAALPTLMQQLLPTNFLHAHSLVFSNKQLINREKLSKQFVQAGYRCVDQVFEHGEFSLRGAIIDLYPMGSPLPYRIELFDNEIESIRTFDPDTQRSIEKQEKIRLLPAHEFPMDENAITRFRQAWREQFSGNPMESPIYEHISRGEVPAGIEYYLALFYPSLSTLFDYLNQDSCIISIGDMQQSAQHFWQEIEHRYEQLRYDPQYPLCSPTTGFIPPNDFFAKLKKFKRISIVQHHKHAQTPITNSIPPKLLVDHKNKQPLAALKNFITENPHRILICAESPGRKETLATLLHENQIDFSSCDNWHTFLESSTPIGLTVGTLTRGLQIDNPQIAVIAEAQLFGEQVVQLRRRKKQSIDPELLVRNLCELKQGDAVVHLDHGVGRYQGLETITRQNIAAEYLTLHYADDAKIFVPVGDLHLISRYASAENQNVILNKLGSNKWEKAKKAGADRARDVAAELLAIYGQREATKAQVFTLPNKEYALFTSAFPFEETPDQQDAIDAVIDDLCSAKHMDRLVCGDVGFGKTEVAMRAAFIAAMNHQQTAVLVPTTLLATQHGKNFQDRLSEWPIKIAVLSRLNTSKQQTKIIESIKSGDIDIVIGTHALLQDKIQYKKLGLLIIDEEHRFGVKQKERIKAMRSEVNILTLTATPIPRTMNMAMISLRDLSIIATPPAKRLSIKTFIQEHNHSLIREAVLREIMRGGQVYFLHNSVKSIKRMCETLQEIVPEAKVQFAHGQMTKVQLENTMADFYHGRFNVLVATTIIESGIDIPTANTIIIDRADRFGLAQLHQLRGRVGRSHHQAYAYLLVPDVQALKGDSKKRLVAITELKELGGGFNLASHDMEIRGAGELLGEEQSGQIHTIGFTLYMDLLAEAVAALKAGKEPSATAIAKQDITVELPIPALIPDNLMPDVSARLVLYKRISNCDSHETLDDLQSELIDRIGLLPDACKNLFTLAKLKLLAKTSGIDAIKANAQFAYLHIAKNHQLNMQTLIQLIQQRSSLYQLQGANTLRIRLNEQEKTLAQDLISLINKLSIKE